MAGLQSDIYAAIFITMAVAFLALSLRLIARRMTRMRELWYDDYFAVAAFIFAVAYCTVIATATSQYGLGQTLDLANVNRVENTLETARLLLWIGSLTYASSIASSKISFLSFYWRLFKFTAIRVPIQVLLVTSAVWIIVRTFLTIFQCLPVQAIWDKTIQDAHCAINQSQFFFASVLVHCLIDVIILVLPIFPVIHMHMSWSKRIGVVCLFSSGVIVCVASVFVLIESITFDSATQQMPRDAAKNWMWAAVEVNMAVFSGSLPMLRNIFRKLFPSCMSSADDHVASDTFTGIQLPPLEKDRRQSAQVPSARKASRPQSDIPSWTNLILEDGSGPSTGPAQGAAHEGDDDDHYDDDDVRDLWQARERRDTGHVDTRRDHDMRAERPSTEPA